MLVRQITVENFQLPGTATLDLPETGITVLEGKNGHGKSRFIEAVAFAHWGKTLRDRDPWLEGVAGRVEVVSAKGVASRKITAKGTRGITWQDDSADTKAATLDRVQAVVGEFDFWRRTHVFRSADGARFSMLTDGEQKRLIERLLGLEVFDLANDAGARELKQLAAAHDEVRQKLADASTRLAAAEATARALTPPAPFEEEPAPVPPASAAAESVRDDLLAKEREHERALSELRSVTGPRPVSRDGLSQAEVALATAQRSVARVRQGRCASCGQAFPAGALAQEEQELARIEEAAQIARQTYDAQWRAEQAAHEERELARRGQEHALTRVHAALAAWNTTQALWQAYDRARAAYDARQQRRREEHDAWVFAFQVQREQAELELAEVKDEVAELLAAVARARQAYEELAFTLEHVLHLRGLRAHVLDRALGGLEQVANYWLRRLSDKASIRLGMSPEGRLELGVSGYGGGLYKGASDGEKRRVDAPLLLALAELAAPAHEARGTLFFDELFDALDQEGIELACAALDEIGERRPIVLITHSGITPRTTHYRYRLENGALRPQG